MYAKYWSIWDTQHPRNNMGCVFVHILLAESLLDRHLTKEEIVHHINENKLDNRYDNILIFDTKASHSKFHNSSHFRIYIKKDVLMCANVPITNPKCGIMKIKDEFKYKKLLSYLD